MTVIMETRESVKNAGNQHWNYEAAIRMMVKIRTAELFIRNAFWDEKIFSFLHLSIGQEACAVGVASALGLEDLCLVITDHTDITCLKGVT